MPQKGMCATCQHFDVRKEYQAGIPASYPGRARINLPPNEECGTCRRFPPLASVNSVAVWPIVKEDEWCSEWKVSERPGYDLGPTGRKPRERP
jgi:hypothetical protein